MQTELLEIADARIELANAGAGPAVLLLPSLGRSAEDFRALAGALAGAGFHALAVNPRGIGASTGELEGITLHELASDLAEVIRLRSAGAAHVLGHAFGNRVARCLAADHPHRVRSLVLLAAGGLIDPHPEALAAFKRFLAPDLPASERLAAVAIANFAPTSDASVWLAGWWPDVARAQAAAARATARADWWRGGQAPMLVLQGLEDRMAPPANGRALQRELGARVELIEIAGAGHALLPEQPARIEREVLRYLRLRQPGR